MKRIPSTKVLSVFSILILLFFTSCNNVFENTISQQQTTDFQEASDDTAEGSHITNAPLTIQVNGNLNVEGALPSEFAKAAGRSAKPSIPDDSSYEYYVKATSADSEKLVREAKIPASEVTGSVQYTLQLEVRRTWSFKAGFRKVNTTDDILIDINSDSGSPITKSLSDDTTSQAVNFRLKPLQKGGKGSLDLKMKKVPDGITKLRLFNNGSEGTNEDWLPSSILEVNVDKDTDDNNYIRSVNGEYNIDSGTYNITMVFYMTYGTAPNQYDIPMYITYQTINVFDNLTTNVWVSNSTSDSNQIITASDGFKLTSDLIQNFAENTIYVGCPEGLNVSTSDDYVGSAYAPLRTLTRAINTIQAKGNGNAYRIFVSGEQSGNFLIPSGINTGKAASIEIKTTTGNSGRAVLNGAGTGSVLTVESAVPLTLSNIQLKNGKGEVEKGGGIMMIAGTTVTLESGTVIGDDSSSISNPADSAVNSSNCAKLGGGIYTLGNLTLKSGSKVCYNYSDGTETEQGGGGIFCIGGSVTLENGAIVSKNGSAGNGGAIYLKDGTLKMSGAASVQRESTNNEAGKNDVWLAAGKYITLTDSAEFSDLVEIRADWKRGKAVVKADNDTIVIKDQPIANKFSLFITEGNGWQTRYYTDRISVNSPIYISANGNNDNDGSENSPFPTIARAIDDMTEADADYEIFIDGTVTGIHSFPSTLKKEVSAGDANGTHYAQSILIKGKNGLYTSGEHQGEPQDVMDGNSEGSVITIESPVPITIEDLKITKGGNTNEGGGINMSIGTDVTIKNGTLITDNKAKSSGGGIFDRGGHLKIIGGKISNNHLGGGSGYDRGGVGVFVGGHKTITKTLFEMTGGEISENDAGTDTEYNGAGVKLRNGNNDIAGPVEFDMSGGKITKNKSPFRGANIFTDVAKIIISDDAEVSYGEIISSSGQAHGAGILLWGGAHLEMNGGKIFGNKATVSNSTKEACAGVFIPRDCHFTMTGGEIYDNNATCSVNGGGILGGAVYVQGEFNLSGTAKIKYGVEDPDTHAVSKGKGKNDICIFQNYNHPIILSDNLSSHTENDPIGINLNDWKRGVSILSATDNFTISDDLQKKFKLTAPDDDGWLKYISSNSKSVTINAPIYVGMKPDGVTAGLDANSGTRSEPFATLSRACQEMTDASVDYIINVNKTVSGRQTIPNTISNDASDGKDYHAKSITISGVTGSSGTSPDQINAGLSAETENGSALTINGSLPVTIEKLKITGGWTSGNGGGIKADNGENRLSLGDGVHITGNQAQYGGGVYIGNNVECYIYGTALIGDDTESTAGANDGQWSNKAVKGGGIYKYGILILGYKYDTPTHDIETTLTGGIKHNYASGDGTEGGGGIYCQSGGYTQIKSGNISYNKSATNGGGIDIQTGDFYMSGGKMENNIATGNGGAINNYGGSTSFISAGTIQKNAATKGGALYNASTTFKLETDVSIPLGSGTSEDPLNEVYIPGTNSIKIDTFTSTTNKIGLVIETPKKNAAVVTGTVTHSGKFTLTNTPGFTLGSTTGKLSLKNIITDIYVKQSGSDPSGNGVTDATWNNSTASYNETTTYLANHPFKTIKRAAEFITYQTNGLNSNQLPDYRIIVDGLLTDAQSLINSDDADNPVSINGATKTLVIQGKNDPESGMPVDGIELTDATSSALTANVSQYRTLTIKDFLIKGGSSSGNGGGINMTLGNLVLGDGEWDGAVRIEGNAATGNGGGIYVYGSLEINEFVAITGNSVTGEESKGGGIFSASSSYSVTMNDGEISNNHADGASALGGGIYSPYFTMEDGIICKNTCGKNGAGVYSSTKFSMSGGRLTGNTAAGNGGGACIGQGGSAVISGSSLIGDPDVFDSTKTDSYHKCPTSTTENANKATRGGGIYGDRISTSSYIYIGYTNSNESSVDSHFSGIIGGNYASVSGAGVFGRYIYMSGGTISYNATAQTSSCNGGGIAINSNGSLKMTGGEIKSNKAYNGGGVYTYTSSIYLSGSARIGEYFGGYAATNEANYSNYAANNGGGIYSDSLGNIYIGYTDSSTPAAFDSETYGVINNCAILDGGGIYSTGGDIYMSAGRSTRNYAGQNGGGIYTKGNIFLHGSAVVGEPKNVLSGSGTQSHSNYAEKLGGGVYIENETTAKGLYLGYKNNSETAALTSGEGTYGRNANNTYKYTAKAGIIYNSTTNDAANANGGGVYASGKVNIYMASGDISFNWVNNAARACYGGGVYFNAESSDYVFDMSGGTITYNEGISGAGIYNNKGKILMHGPAVIGLPDTDIDPVTVTNEYDYCNHGRSTGAGIMNAGGIVCLGYSAWASETENTPATLDEGYGIRGNSSYIGTGGVHNSGGATFAMASGVICHNQSRSNNGGGISVQGTSTVPSKVIIEGGKICNNYAKQAGGGIWNGNYSSTSIEDAIICDNTVNDTGENLGGGAIFVGKYSTLSLKGNVSIPSGVDGNTGVGKNDICLLINDTQPAQSTKITVAGKLSGAGVVGIITPCNSNYIEAEHVVELTSGVTDTTLENAVACFAVTPQTSPSTQTWTIGADGKLLKSVEYTSANIADFGGSSTLTNGAEYHFVLGPDVTNDQFKTFMSKIYNSGSIKISANSTLDLSKATKLTGVPNSWPSVSAGAYLQAFDSIIIGPNFSATWCENDSNENIHYLFLDVKKIIAPSNCVNFVSDENGILFNKDMSKIEFYPGGRAREETSYTIPSTVTEIAAHAFNWATSDSKGLKTIIIPASVKTIGVDAFPVSSSFTTLTFMNTSGWHIGSTSGTAVSPSDLNATYYKSTLKNSKLVKE